MKTFIFVYINPQGTRNVIGCINEQSGEASDAFSKALKAEGVIDMLVAVKARVEGKEASIEDIMVDREQYRIHINAGGLTHRIELRQVDELKSKW